MALRLITEPEWVTALQDAGIPPTESNAYATIFVNNRINNKTVLHLTADDLKSLDITVLGDILAILQYAKTINSSKMVAEGVSTTPTYRPPPATVKLPSIVTEMTHPQFRKLRIDWDVYKKVTNIPSSQIGPLLYSACEGNVQTSIINSYPKFFEQDETTMLESIEQIVTKRVNPTVHRMNFKKITQHDNETIQDFLTRLRSSAVDCEYSCPECQYDLSHVNIKDQFIQGLANETLQTDILAKAGQLKSVEDVVKHAEAWEGAVRDQSELQASNEISHISEYRKNKNKSKYNKQQQQQQPPPQQRQQQQPPPQQQLSCSGCGSTSHGYMGSPYPRHKYCPEWGKTCESCNRLHHSAPVCRNPASIRANFLVAHLQYNSQNDLFTSPKTLQ